LPWAVRLVIWATGLRGSPGKAWLVIDEAFAGEKNFFLKETHAFVRLFGNLFTKTKESYKEIMKQKKETKKTN
jgi:hypothetical protein